MRPISAARPRIDLCTKNPPDLCSLQFPSLALAHNTEVTVHGPANQRIVTIFYQFWQLFIGLKSHENGCENTKTKIYNQNNELSFLISTSEIWVRLIITRDES